MTDHSIREWIAAELAEFEIPGAAVAIVQPGREAVFSFGVRRIGESAAVDGETAFSLASCSKAFTAFGLALLVDRGVLGFDDPIRKFLPEFTLDKPELAEVATLRDLLGMRLGLQPLGACHWGRSRAFSHAEMFGRLQYLPRIAPFREGFVYFNPAYSALAETIARVGGARFADFMASEVFAPLGMTNTFIEEGPVVRRSNVAVPHVKTARGMIALSTPRCGGREGESCQYICAADLLPWLRLHLSGASPAGRRLLSPQTQAELHTIQMPTPWPDGEAGYCMGWMRGRSEGRVVLTHEGGEFGASTFAILCPDEQIGLVVLLSRRTGAGVRSLAYGLRDRLLGGAIPDRRREHLELERKENEASELARSCPVDPAQPIRDLADFVGSYRSPHSGLLTLSREGNRLRAAFEDIDTYNCRLEPLGGDVFRLTDFDELGMQQEVRGEARLRIVTRDENIRVVEATGLGSFHRVD